MTRKSLWRALRETESWRDRRGIVRGLAWTAWFRTCNRWSDMLARLSGACNRDTWTGEPPSFYAGGYSHWRCGKRRGHTEPDPVRPGSPHRFINYVWDGPGTRVEYAPLPTRNADNTGWYDLGAVLPFRRLTSRRRPVATRRRARLQAGWYEARRKRRTADRA